MRHSDQQEKKVNQAYLWQKLRQQKLACEHNQRGLVHQAQVVQQQKFQKLSVRFHSLDLVHHQEHDASYEQEKPISQGHLLILREPVQNMYG